MSKPYDQENNRVTLADNSKPTLSLDIGRRELLKLLGFIGFTGGSLGALPQRVSGLHNPVMWVWTQAGKLAANDGDSEDYFGGSVAIDGDTVVIGAPADEDPNGLYSGSAYVFTRASGSWSQQAKLAANDGDSEDGFGVSVAVDGDTAVIGANHDEDPNGGDGQGDGAGSAYVFTRASGSWSQQAKLAANDGDSGDDFGVSVAVDGDTAVIGAWDDEDPNGFHAGSAYVFTRASGSWSQQAKLAANDGDSEDQFGESVAVDGDTAVIGAEYHDDPNGRYAGAAYVFTRTSGSWSQQAKLAANDGDATDNFGASVAVDGDTTVVGAVDDIDPNGFDAGSAYVFTRTSGSWSQQAKLAANDGDTGDNFGESVAVDGDTAVIGAQYDEDPNGEDSGAAYVFTRTSGSWNQQAKLAANDGDSEDGFGGSVSIDGDTAAIGAATDEDPNGEAAGAAYVFAERLNIDFHIITCCDFDIINLDEDDVVRVGIPKTEETDPGERVAVESLRFGTPEVVRGGEGARPVDAYLEDVLPEEGDGREDLVVDFPIKDTDLHSDVERVRLEGETNEGEPLFGDLDVEIVGEE